MKFSEYVGESLEELKSQIKKNKKLKPKPITETLVSFSLGKKHLKRVFDYLKSWFVRYKIPYESVNPYLTLFKVTGVKDKHELMTEIKGVKKYPFFENGELVIVREGNRDYLTIIFSLNDEFMGPLREIFMDKDIQVIKEFAYVKLIVVEKDSFSGRFWDDMVYSMPKIPNIKPGSVGLLSRRVK